MLVVQAFAGVLLEMQAGDADLARAPVGHVEHDPAMPDDRLQILRDLIARGQVGVEIVFAVEDAVRLISASRPSPVLTACSTQMAVDDRQHAGKSRVDRRDLGVGLGPEPGRRPRKQFRLGDHLGMDFQPDHGLPFTGAAFDQCGHGNL